MPTLETDRLRLRPFAPDLSDVDPMFLVLSDPISMRWYPHPFDLQETRRWVERWLERYDADEVGLLVIEDRRTGEFLGDCGPSIQEVDGEPMVELGWHVLRARQREGIATEAGAACREWAFANVDTPFLISLIRPENVASRRVAEKLGFEIWRGTIRVGCGHLVYRLDRPSPD